MGTGQDGQHRAQAATAHQHRNGDKANAVRAPVVDNVAFEGAQSAPAHRQAKHAADHHGGGNRQTRA
jgi:hypothetical protein